MKVNRGIDLSSGNMGNGYFIAPVHLLEAILLSFLGSIGDGTSNEPFAHAACSDVHALTRRLDELITTLITNWWY